MPLLGIPLGDAGKSGGERNRNAQKNKGCKPGPPASTPGKAGMHNVHLITILNISQGCHA